MVDSPPIKAYGWANVETQLDEVTWGDSPRISARHKFKYAGELWDTGWPRWVDSFSASSDITAVCSLTTDFTLVMPVFSLSCAEKMVLSNYLCTRTYDTGASFELIFMKFACSIQVRQRMNPIVFGNNWPNRTTDTGENVSPKPFFFFGFHSACMEFFMEKTYKQYVVPHSPTEKVQLIFVVQLLLCLKNGHVPQDLFFAVILENIFFSFEKNCLMKNIWNLISYKKGYIDFCY